MFTFHLQHVPKLRMSGTTITLFLYAFAAWRGKNLLYLDDRERQLFL
jgi:hypothetical protein